MASVQTSKYDGRYLKLTVVEESTSIENNTSTVRWTLESIGGNSNYYNVYSIEVKINNVTKYGPTTKTWDSREFPAAKGSTSGTVTIEHNQDGTASPLAFSLRGSVYNNNPQTYSDTLTLSTIPRASQITVSDENIGSGASIMINKASDSFTTTIRYRALKPNGTYTDWSTIVTKSNFKEVLPWTVPTSLYALIPNNRTITCEFEATTYSGNTQIGTPTTTTATFTANVYPTINNISKETVDELSFDLTGNHNTIIKGVSALQIIVNASAGTGANIDHYVIAGQSTSSSQKIITKASSNTYSVSVYDTRGEPPTTESITMPNAMVEYVPLTLSASIKRNQPTDGKINITYSGNYFNSSFGAMSNSLTVQYRAVQRNGSWDNVEWTNLSPTIPSGSNTYSQTNYIIESDRYAPNGYDYTKQYEFQIRAMDEIYDDSNPVSILGITVSKGQPIFNWADGLFNVNAVLIANNFSGIRVANVNLDNYKQTGIYYFTTGCTNAPSQYFLCMIWGSNTNYAVQIGVQIGGNGNMYYRKINETTWSNWKQISVI